MSATSLDYVDIDVAAFRALTSNLTMAELGLFVGILDAYLCFGCLPKDTERLAAMITVDRDEFASAWPAVRRLCHETEDGYRVPIPGAG